MAKKEYSYVHIIKILFCVLLLYFLCVSISDNITANADTESFKVNGQRYSIVSNINFDSNAASSKLYKTVSGKKVLIARNSNHEGKIMHFAGAYGDKLYFNNRALLSMTENDIYSYTENQSGFELFTTTYWLDGICKGNMIIHYEPTAGTYGTSITNAFLQNIDTGKKIFIGAKWNGLFKTVGNSILYVSSAGNRIVVKKVSLTNGKIKKVRTVNSSKNQWIYPLKLYKEKFSYTVDGTEYESLSANNVVAYYSKKKDKMGAKETWKKLLSQGRLDIGRSYYFFGYKRNQIRYKLIDLNGDGIKDLITKRKTGKNLNGFTVFLYRNGRIYNVFSTRGTPTKYYKKHKVLFVKNSEFGGSIYIKIKKNTAKELLTFIPKTRRISQDKPYYYYNNTQKISKARYKKAVRKLGRGKRIHFAKNTAKNRRKIK